MGKSWKCNLKDPRIYCVYEDWGLLDCRKLCLRNSFQRMTSSFPILNKFYKNHQPVECETLKELYLSPWND